MWLLGLSCERYTLAAKQLGLPRYIVSPSVLTPDHLCEVYGLYGDSLGWRLADILPKLTPRFPFGYPVDPDVH